MIEYQQEIKKYALRMDVLHDLKNAGILASILVRKIKPSHKILTSPVNCFLCWELAKLDMGYQRYDVCSFSGLLKVPSVSLEYAFETCLRALKNPKTRYNHKRTRHARLDFDICESIIYHISRIDDIDLCTKVIDYCLNLLCENVDFTTKVKNMLVTTELIYDTDQEYINGQNALISLQELNIYNDGWIPLPELIFSSFVNEETRIRRLYVQTML